MKQKYSVYIRSDNWLFGRWIDSGESHASIELAIVHAKYLSMVTKRVARVRVK